VAFYELLQVRAEFSEHFLASAILACQGLRAVWSIALLDLDEETVLEVSVSSSSSSVASSSSECEVCGLALSSPVRARISALATVFANSAAWACENFG